MILTTRKQVFQWLRNRGCTVAYAWDRSRNIGKPRTFGTGIHTFQTY